MMHSASQHALKQAKADSANIGGFTLVELAISLMVIGLLLGGVLKGQELLDNASVLKTIRAFKAYQTALVTFTSKYDALPGDMLNPQGRITNCTTAPCNVAGNNDDVIFGNYADVQYMTPFIEGWASGGVMGEVQNFFLHIQKEGLVGGVSPTGASSGSPFRYGFELPEAPFDGTGFFAYSVDKETYLAWTGTYPGGGAVQGLMARPWHIRAIDAKLDDGKPLTGTMRVDPLRITGCYSMATGVGEYLANNTVGLAVCEPAFRLQ